MRIEKSCKEEPPVDMMKEIAEIAANDDHASIIAGWAKRSLSFSLACRARSEAPALLRHAVFRKDS